MTRIIFSLGHSSHSWDHFRALVEQSDVGCIIDVRSAPTSRWAHFRKQELRTRLNQIGISYQHLGDQLGGHPKDGAASYQAMVRAPAFAEGIAQVFEVADRCRPALLCSEHDPLQCHRFLLIARHLAEQHEVQIEHVLRDGCVEAHEHTEDRLLALHGGTHDLFQDRRDRLAYAYDWQARRLGMRP